MVSTKQKLVLFLAGIALSLGFFMPLPATAAPAAGLVTCGIYSAGTYKPCTFLDMFVLIAKVTNFLIACSGIYAVYVIINNSFSLVVFAMGNEESITKGKEGITNAVIGLILVLMAFMIVNTVTNVLITRDIVVNSPNSPCKLDLRNPTTYLSIGPTQCSNLPETLIHVPGQ